MKNLRPIFAVSACLAGICCRYNAVVCAVPAVVQLVEQGLALPLCPEHLGGLPTPRSPCELRDGRVFDTDGVERTVAFVRGTDEAMRRVLEAGITRAILKVRSPSCGAGQIYDGTFSGRLISGDGLWAAALRNAGVTLFSEEQLPDGAYISTLAATLSPGPQQKIRLPLSEDRSE